MNKKRKQHYVWEHYLLAWATDGQIWCRRDNRHFRVSTDRIANRRDFYRLQQMSANDFALVHHMIAKIEDPLLKNLARGWIPHFQLAHEIKRQSESAGQQSAELNRVLDTMINNHEEDIHATIEGKAIPILAALRQFDMSPLKDESKYVDFSLFMAMQYMRTPKTQNSVINAAAGFKSFNIEAVWGLLRTIFASNIGASLFARRKTTKFSFLEAPSESEILTADQPLINLRAHKSATTELELYYPITPKYALLVDVHDTNSSFLERKLSLEEVRYYNSRIASDSLEQVYAKSEKALQGIANLPASTSSQRKL